MKALSLGLIKGQNFFLSEILIREVFIAEECDYILKTTISSCRHRQDNAHAFDEFGVLKINIFSI